MDHRVCIVIHTRDTLHPDCAISHYLLASFVLSSSAKLKFVAYKTTSATSYMHRAPRVKGHMEIVLRLTLCIQKWLAKLTVDYSEDQRSQRIVSNIALSAINNTFGVHSDDVQDLAMS